MSLFKALLRTGNKMNKRQHIIFKSSVVDSEPVSAFDAATDELRQPKESRFDALVHERRCC